jgi:phosphotransferase system HPr (HPr) family protein
MRQSAGARKPVKDGLAKTRGSVVTDAVRVVTIENSQGLHARPVMKFVDIARQYQSRIIVKKGNHGVDGKDPMEMMLLEAPAGTELELFAEGPDAAMAVEDLAQLVKNKFDEE